MFCKHITIALMHNHSYSDSLGCLRWSSHLTPLQLLDSNWEKKRDWGRSKPWCLSQGWKLWMFSRHCAKTWKLLHITLLPHRLKKETGLPSTPLKELKEKNLLLCLVKWNICPSVLSCPFLTLPLLCLTQDRELVGTSLWYFPSLFKKRKEWNDFPNGFRKTWAAGKLGSHVKACILQSYT